MSIFAYDYYTNEYNKVYANYYLEFAERVNIEDMLQIPFNDVDRNPKTLCIQEADKVFDSRSSMREENKLLSSLTGQAGKRNLNILYDTQLLERVDKGLRRVTEYLITCTCFINMINKSSLAFQYLLIDLYDLREKKFLLTINDKINGIAVKDYFDMYDSYESTKPLTKR